MKRIFTTALLLLFAPLLALAQGDAQGHLTVVTNPPGAEVTLEGDMVLASVSPASFTYPVMGEYKLIVRKNGYETYKSNILVDPRSAQEVAVDLSPRTAFKATIRSMVLPGWGQFYSGRKTRGTIFTSLFAGALIAFAAVDADYQDKKDVFDDRLVAYDEAVTQQLPHDVLQNRHLALVDAQNAAYDAEDDRRTTAGLVFGVWALGVLDAIFFTPDERATFSVKGISLTPTQDNGRFGLSLTKGF